MEQGKFFIKNMSKIYVYILIGYLNYSVYNVKAVNRSSREYTDVFIKNFIK